MDPKFRSSFIPKKPLDTISAVNREKHRSVNLFSVISIVVFVLSAAAAVGVFGYQLSLAGDIDKKGAELKRARETIDLTSINNLKKFESHVDTAQLLLNNHVALSSFFEFLNESTLKKVQFDELEYGKDAAGGTLVSLRGVADNYNSLVLQTDVFIRDEILKDPKVTETSLDDVGRIKFLVTSPIHPDFIHYSIEEEVQESDLFGDFEDSETLVDEDIQ